MYKQSKGSMCSIQNPFSRMHSHTAYLISLVTDHTHTENWLVVHVDRPDFGPGTLASETVGD